MYQYASRPEVEKQINKQQNTLPHDLLQRGIASLSSSPETYLFIRSQFAKTLAVFNIASYIVGIGDRHLENFLLDMSSYYIYFDMFQLTIYFLEDLLLA